MSDGYVLRGRVWPPTHRNVRHAIIYLHGIQSHGGWFEWSASLLAQHGCAVVMPDRRGSGLNQDNRGDTPSRQRWLLDVDELADWAGSEFGAKQFDVLGVSWGGKQALAWELERVDLVRRLLLIAPGLFPAVDVGARERFRIGRALLTGGKRSFEIPLNDPELFTDNPAGQDFIRNDPLKLTHATARFLWHSRRLDRQLIKAPDGVLRAETTLALAGRDRIIRNEPTEAWLRRVGRGGVRTVRFEDAAHTLEFAADEVPYRTLLEGWAAGHD
jgi:alpha-beta hydrolase superfamily lysophospholipase